MNYQLPLSTESSRGNHYGRPSVAVDTIVLITVSIASFALANRVEWDSPRFGRFLRLIPVGGALLWLLRRMSGCEVGSTVRIEEGGSRVRFRGSDYGDGSYGTELHSFPPSHPLPPTPIYTTPRVPYPPQPMHLTSSSSFQGVGPGSVHAYTAPHLESRDDDEKIFPVGYNSGTTPGYPQRPPSHPTSSSVGGPGQRHTYVPDPPQQQSGGWLSNWLGGFGGGSRTTSTTPSTFTDTGSFSSWSSHSVDHTDDWGSSSPHSTGGGGGSEPTIYPVGSQTSSQSGPGPIAPIYFPL